MKILKYISSFTLTVAAIVGLASCGGDEFTESIFSTEDEVLDSTSYTYNFDKWLQKEFLEVYNLEFIYKMQDVGSDMDYNLVPASYDKAVDLAVLCKYLWFDSYKVVAGEEFLKAYGPRIIHLIGSPAYNPQSGTMVLGLAEGGIKVTLYRVNQLSYDDVDILNEYYFKTMHHEFAHILHQTKSIPSAFNLLSVGHYDSNNWQDQVEGRMNSLGFVSNYASSAIREDFAETIANYVVKTDAQWARILELASRGWEAPADADETDVSSYYCFYYYANNDSSNDKSYVDESSVITVTDSSGNVSYRLSTRDSSGNYIVVYAVDDTDGVDGVSIIEQKVSIARTWLADEWSVDLDSLRAEVQRRQSDFDIEALRKQIDE